ncbi:MAG: chromosome segregation protein SMC [Thermoanaerobaculia bacterium]
MFRLEKLEISGFKSFYDPAELMFPAPMTAIVGPNGCGKSNICDAIIWVLGEHRASNIRGETMEDVIFQGSERRRPLGMGEVTLTLSTDNGHPEADDGRISINRRVFRSGESEFRLNGKRVRLKDISDILMDTGLGIRNYSVMEQGKIDLILSNKPQDRRRLIEEAAGITKYKSKRRAAELKLDETQANLLRIDDTLAEVNRNLNSLKRQAAKARRHKEFSELLSTAKRSLYAGKVIFVRGEQEAAEQALAAGQAAESEAAATLAREEAALAETRTVLSGRATRLAAIRDDGGRMNAEAERLRTFLEQSETNLSDLLLRAETGRGQISELNSEAAEQQAVLEEKRRTLEAATLERNRLREVADDLERNRQEKSDAVRTHEKTIASSRETLMRTIARISEARNQGHQIEIAVEKCEFYLGKLNETAKKVLENRDDARLRMEEHQKLVHEAEQALVDAQQKWRDAVERRDALTASRDGMRDSLKSSRDVISQTTYRLDSLRTLLMSLESQEEEVRRAVLELAPTAAAAAESVHASEGFETALDALLRDISRAVVVESSDTAIEAIHRLRERGAGRGSFVTLDFRPEEWESAPGDAHTAILGDGAIADAVRAAVTGTFIVPDLRAAIAQARLQPHATFVTRDGDMVRGPIIQGGRHEGARGVFTIKRELSDLEQLLTVEETKATGIASELQNVELELASADDARIIAEEHVKQAENQLREKSGSRDRVVSELERFEKDLEVATEERSLYEEEKAQLLTRKSQALEMLQSLEKSEQETQQGIRESEEALQAARVEFESITEVASKARVDLEAASGNVNAIQREHENASRVVASLTSRVKLLESEIASIDTRRSETDHAVVSSREQLGTLLVALTELGEQRIVVEGEVSDLDARVRELETSAVAARDAWNAQRESLFENERRLDRARAAFNLLREQISLDLHAGIDALTDVEPPADDESRDALESEVARLADQIEKIGPVNVLAIDEYKELEEREKFLRTQRDDLVQSIESLRSTIRKINLTSRELFRDAFAAINKSFVEIFTALFGGGVAGMQLLDEEDLLESGIELVAQPPGKKTQSIALLSGGERALTALALLFAIFRYKPSPFCLLDEVDAPLDEVNNERFVRLVRDMSRDTQFIVITHSKRTMEAADVLYGVTMEEAGCSRLVSVSFAEMEA